MTIRKLEKAVAVSGISLGVPGENLGNSRENLSHLAECLKFWSFADQNRQTCREPWVDTALNLVCTFCGVSFWNRQLQPSQVFLRVDKWIKDTPPLPWDPWQILVLGYHDDFVVAHNSTENPPQNLSGLVEIEPLSRHSCSNAWTPVALGFSGCRKLSLLCPLLAHQNCPIAATKGAL